SNYSRAGALERRRPTPTTGGGDGNGNGSSTEGEAEVGGILVADPPCFSFLTLPLNHEHRYKTTQTHRLTHSHTRQLDPGPSRSASTLPALLHQVVSIMVPKPGSTFTVRDTSGSDSDPSDPEEIWLSADPGRTTTSLRDCREDQRFGYHIKIASDFPHNASTSTHTNLGANARHLSDNLVITSSGLEEDPETGISARSSSLLDQLCEIIDGYLDDDPRRALLHGAHLSAPKLSNRLLVRRGTTEAPFNYLYEERVLCLTEALLELSQEACRWKQAQKTDSGRPFRAPLPTSPDSRILIISSARANDSGIIVSKRIKEVSTLADADFYVTVGSHVVATVESEPGCRPHNVGDLVRERSDPFRQQEIGEVRGETETLRLLSQICSQPTAAGSRKGLLIADWGRLLLPFELRNNATENGGAARLTFASTASWCDVLEGEKACKLAELASRDGLAGRGASSFRLQHLPNSVFFLLGWILYAIEDLPDDSDDSGNSHKPESQPHPDAGDSVDDEESEDSGPSAKRTRLQECSGNIPSEALVLNESSARDSESKGSAIESETERLPLITAYVCTYGPILGGTYADIHRCVVDRAHLAGSPREALSPSQENQGRPALGILPPLRRGDCYTYLKVQRVPSEPDPEEDLPEPRFEEPDGPPLSAEDAKGIRERTTQEIEIFQRCKDIQGTVLPRLYGLVSPESYPRSTAPKLMLQHLDAEPVGTSDSMWRCIWGDTVQQAVEAAFSKLHARRVCHEDVNTSNILIEWRRKASGSSTRETLEISKLRELVQQAQREMKLSHRELATAARKLREDAGFDPDGDSGLVPEVSESPLSRLRDSIKPRIWLIDFAGSVIVEDGEKGDALLTSEARKVKETMEEWARERYL
ncbi:hypothetical protein BCV69DRAFT_176824, partial [Microstroma glucosiphilum]